MTDKQLNDPLGQPGALIARIQTNLQSCGSASQRVSGSTRPQPKKTQAQPAQPAPAAAASSFAQNRQGTGTKQWADKNYNFCVGCAHDCLYCYARTFAVTRFGRVAPGDWSKQIVLDDNVAAAARVRSNGVIMFPTTHDLTPAVLPQALRTLQNLLSGGNKVLVVSKPHLSVIKTLCRKLVAYRDRLLFRFTIGSEDAKTCALWEPGAPPPAERIAALKHAFDGGYPTSVSMEPMLGYNNGQMIRLVHRVAPYVTDSIWLGKMKGIILKEFQERPGVRTSLVSIRAAQSNSNILALQQALANHPKVRWKDSIQKVLLRHGKLGGAQAASQSTQRPSSSTLPSNTIAPPTAAQTTPAPVALSPAHQAWITMRQRYTPEQIAARSRKAAKKAWKTMRAKKAAAARAPAAI